MFDFYLKVYRNILIIKRTPMLSHKQKTLLMALTLSTQICIAEETSLLEIEREYVGELIALQQYELATEHLKIVEKEFPQEDKWVASQYAHIYFHQGNFKEAIPFIEASQKNTISFIQQQKLMQWYLVSLERTESYSKAISTIKQVPEAYYKLDWFTKQTVDIIEATYQETVKQPANKRMVSRSDCIIIITKILAVNPDTSSAPWLNYFLAEYEYDKLSAMMLRIESGNKKLTSADDDLMIQVFKVRSKFKAIEAENDLTLSERVNARLGYIEQLMKKL